MPGVVNSLRVRDSLFHLLAGSQVKTIIRQRRNILMVMVLLYPCQGLVKDIIFRLEKSDRICSHSWKAHAFGQCHGLFHDYSPLTLPSPARGEGKFISPTLPRGVRREST